MRQANETLRVGERFVDETMGGKKKGGQKAR